MIASSTFFFFNDTATTEIYTLSLHDALPILARAGGVDRQRGGGRDADQGGQGRMGLPDRPVGGLHLAEKPRDLEAALDGGRSEEHTSELQSRQYLVCRLLLEKKNKHYHHPQS